MNKKLYKFISKEEYERIVKVRAFYIKRKKEIPAQYNRVYKEAEDGSYYRPKNLPYERVIVMLLREKYSVDDEFALLRQEYIKQDEYQEYFNYVESCKQQAKEFVAMRDKWFAQEES